MANLRCLILGHDPQERMIANGAFLVACTRCSLVLGERESGIDCRWFLRDGRVVSGYHTKRIRLGPLQWTPEQMDALRYFRDALASLPPRED